MPSLDLEACYRTLEVAPGASEQDIRRAYKVLVNVWHPDRFEHDGDLRRAAEEKLKAVNDAFAAVRAAGFSYVVGAVEPPAAAPPPDRSRPPVKAKPTSPPRAPRTPALETLLTSASGQSSAEHFDKAIVLLREAVGLYPQSFEAWHALAWACHTLHFRLHSAAPSPGYRDQLSRLAIPDQALLAESNRACYEAVRLDPNRMQATQLLESVLSSWAPHAELRAFCESYAEQHPTNARAWENLGYLLYVADARKVAAAKAFRQCLTLDSGNAGVWFRLGLCTSIDRDWNGFEECRANLRRLGQGGQATILGSVPLRVRLRRWFQGEQA